MPYRKLAQAILADWRAAERDLQAVNGDHHERQRLEGGVERLRDEYRGLQEEAHRNLQLDLPPFPPTPDELAQ